LLGNILIVNTQFDQAIAYIHRCMLVLGVGQKSKIPDVQKILLIIN